MVFDFISPTFVDNFLCLFQTFSSYRILLQAQKEGKPIFIINIGATRADHLAKYKINSLASLVLSSVAVSSVT